MGLHRIDRRNISFDGPPENTMQRYMTVHVTCQNHVSYMTFNISDMHFDMSEHFEHVVCHATIHVIYHVVLPMKMCLHHNFSTTEPIWMILLSTESSWLSDFKYTRFWVGYSNKFLQMSDKLLTQAWEWLHKKVKKSLRKWHVHLGLNEEISDKLISWESVKNSASYGSLKFKEYCRKGLFGLVTPRF